MNKYKEKLIKESINKLNQNFDILNQVLTAHGYICLDPDEVANVRYTGGQGTDLVVNDCMTTVLRQGALKKENSPYNVFKVWLELNHDNRFEAPAVRDLLSDEVQDKLNQTIDDDGHVLEPLDQILDKKDLDINKFKQCLIEEPPKPDLSLLETSGFINDVYQYAVNNAPRVNPVLAYCGALALQATLAKRNYRFKLKGTRPNIYIMGLDVSASGKDFPRKLNTRILTKVGMSENYYSNFASGQGVEDGFKQLEGEPVLLLQTDEIQGVLKNMSQGRSEIANQMVGILNEFYNASQGVYKTRLKAAKDKGKADDHTLIEPHLSLFGTAPPKLYYEALNAAMVENGFLSRCIILDGLMCEELKTNNGAYEEIPDKIIDYAKQMADQALMQDQEIEVGYTPNVGLMLERKAAYYDDVYNNARNCGQEYIGAVTGRILEKTIKICLLYAISDNPKKPVVTEHIFKTANALIEALALQTLHQAHINISDDDFHKKAMNLLKAIKSAGEQGLMRKQAFNYIRKPKELDEALVFLEESDYINTITSKNPRNHKISSIYVSK